MYLVKEEKTIQISFITNQNGEKEFIIFPAEYFDQELIEDVNDVIVAKQKLKSGNFIKL